jgi:hypothetical protein
LNSLALAFNPPVSFMSVHFSFKPSLACSQRR